MLSGWNSGMPSGLNSRMPSGWNSGMPSSWNSGMPSGWHLGATQECHQDVWLSRRIIFLWTKYLCIRWLKKFVRDLFRRSSYRDNWYQSSSWWRWQTGYFSFATHCNITFFKRHLYRTYCVLLKITKQSVLFTRWRWIWVSATLETPTSGHNLYCYLLWLLLLSFLPLGNNTI